MLLFLSPETGWIVYPTPLRFSAYKYVRGRSPQIVKKLCYPLCSRLSGWTFSQDISPKRRQNLRSQSCHCCCNACLGLIPRSISISQNWQHGHLRLRTRLMGSLAGISHDRTFCHCHTAPSTSRSITLSIRTMKTVTDGCGSTCGVVVVW